MQVVRDIYASLNSYSTIFRLSIAVTMSTSFGYDIPAGDLHDKFITAGEQISAAISKLCHPGGTIINAIPFLRHIPPWFPGASVQRYAAKARKLAMSHKTEPFEYVRSRFVNCPLAHVRRQLKIVRSWQGPQRIA